MDIAHSQGGEMSPVDDVANSERRELDPQVQSALALLPDLRNQPVAQLAAVCDDIHHRLSAALSRSRTD